MTLDHRPDAVRLGRHGCAFVNENRSASGQRTINHVTMSGHPADIGRAPIQIGISHIENQLSRAKCAHEVAASAMNDTLGLTGRPAGVENEKWMLGVQFLRTPERL